ncbi:MAG: MoaD/ThiS family protein [Gammaproteobacteria bacterium]|jgi:molybdopterin synthase sulfur carrier subunit|nr:MoaD/ThiS family protein [Gammaproteobacteria bacterium]MBT4607331.1 MoaD/ThiS family protein [Thiotrichales bacterium]MBT3472951.1 MoaD/ThiS family protein [Gammaproteobacteria bacterium]MBT3968405.1 MoaD/ThiS family protein [Gammaproteobacteria bacterium]MBT4080344.1 MoaD/ThiS family protein [Gammaproteobacteria bacterium]
MTRILYFARLSEVFKKSGEPMMKGSAKTVGEIIQRLKARGDLWDKMLVEGQFQIMVNKQIVNWDHPIKDGDEIALV